MFRSLLSFVLALSCSDFWRPSLALAEPLRQSVVVSVQPDGGDAVPKQWPSMVHRALVARRDRDVLDARALAERLHNEGRRARPARQSSQLLRTEADAVLEAAAFGQDSEAISRGQLLLARYRPDIDALGAADDAARAITDTCLFVVRALLHQGKAEGAHVQARECARLVPDLVSSADLHPPEVRALFVRARSEAPLGRLTVRAETSTGCLLRLQGRPVAKLPVTVDLVPGAYAVQAECEKAGFVRDVQIEPNAQRQLDTAPDLEAAVPTEGAGLDYPYAPALAAERRDRLTLLLRWLRVDELWTVERRADALDLRRFLREGDALVEAGERIVPVAPVQTFEGRVQAAVMAIGGSKVPSEQSRREISEASQSRQTVATIGVIGGTLAIAGSWLAFIRTSSLEAELETMTYADPSYGDVLRSRDTFRTLAVASTVTGSVLLAGTAFAWLPQEKGIPWWALAAGAGGAVAAGFGTVLWMQNGELETARCPHGEACLRSRSTLPLAPMLLTQGIALLSLPATYVVRGWASRSAGIDVRASSTTLSVVVRGRL